MDENEYKKEKLLNQMVIENFLKRTGNRGAKILSVLGRDQQFINALNTAVGQELLKDLLFMLDDRLDKIARMEATDHEKAEYTALLKLHDKWLIKINRHTDLLDKLIKEGA